MPDLSTISQPPIQSSSSRKALHGRDSTLAVSTLVLSHPASTNVKLSKMGERKKAQLDELTKQILELVKREEETKLEQKSKQKLIESLEDFFQNNLESQIYVIGSNYGKFAVKKDRLEVVFTKLPPEIDEVNVHRYIFNKMQDRDLDFENLKMKYTGEIMKDGNFVRLVLVQFTSPNFLITGTLKFDDGGSIRNSHLIRCYTRMDDRVRPLLMAVKVWWFSNKLRANKFGLTSFDLALMLIHYLQDGCKPPVLPCLSEILPDVFKHDSDFDQLDPDMELPEMEETNAQQLGDLLVDFLDYFANKFDFKKRAISVRVGRAIKIKQSRHFGKHDYICIEDPFTRKCTVSQVVVSKKPLKIRNSRGSVKQAFKNAHSALIRNHDLKVLQESRKTVRIGKLLRFKEIAGLSSKLMQVARTVNPPSKIKQ